MKNKFKIAIAIVAVLIVAGLYLYFKYFFTYEQKNIFQRNVETITGQNLTITVFGFDGKIIKRWTGVKKISSGRPLQ